MAKNTVPIIIGAVVLGLIALGLTIFVLKGAAPPPPVETPVAQAVPKEHYVAARAIAPRTLITRDMLTESSGEAPPNAITDPFALVGRIANKTIQAGQVLTSDVAISPIGRVIPANIPIPAGMRGVAIWVNPDETAAGLVDIGDQVDVVATHQLTLEKSGNQVIIGAAEFTSGRTIAQDLQVLAVDKSITEARPALPPANGQVNGANGQANPGANGANGAADPNNPNGGANPPAAEPAPAPAAPSVTRHIRVLLAAPPDIAQRLIAANAQGELHITIRNPVSHERFVTTEAREYPSRIAAGVPAPAAPKTASSGGGNNNNGNSDRGGNVMPQPSFGPSIAPATPTTKEPVKEVPAGKEVTVIRGTEKTRAIVPR